MTVRITKEWEREVTILHIDGLLDLEDIIELDRASQGPPGPLVLELSHLQSADTAGIAALCELASTGAEIRGASGYVKMLLSLQG